MKYSSRLNSNLSNLHSFTNRFVLNLFRFGAGASRSKKKKLGGNPRHPKNAGPLRGKLLKIFRRSKSNLPLERGARLVSEGKSVPQAAKIIGRSDSTLRRYLHLTNQARKTKSGRITVPRYRAHYWIRIFSEAKFKRVHLNRTNVKKAGDYMQAVRDAIDESDQSFIAPYKGEGVKDLDGTFHPFETRMNILFRLHFEQSAEESLDLEYEIEAG